MNDSTSRSTRSSIALRFVRSVTLGLESSDESCPMKPLGTMIAATTLPSRSAWSACERDMRASSTRCVASSRICRNGNFVPPMSTMSGIPS